MIKAPAQEYFGWQAHQHAPDTGMWIWAHRGARSVAPENTLAAAQAAVEQQAHGWELDVQMTKDGQLVVLHDFALRRVTDIARTKDFPDRRQHVISALTRAELSLLDAGSWFARRDPFGTVAGGQVSRAQCEHFAGESVPDLDQAVAWTRSTPLGLNIEIKGPPGRVDLALAEAVAHAVRCAQMPGRILISSFTFGYLAQIKTIDAQLPLAWLLTRRDCDQPWAKLIDTALGIPVGAVHLPLAGLGPGMTAALHKAGLLVQVYTVNSPDHLLWLALEGVDGVFTDFPGQARAVLGSRALHAGHSQKQGMQ
ncbi:glycerophosphodiester phosphodiesterase family protein [Desulfovibrionales bacterium]